MKISVCAADAIDRVEILKNNVLEEMIVHSGTWENKTYGADETIRVKFAVEFGWGPNPRFYKDMLVREWNGSLYVEGRLHSIDKAWNSYGQKLYDVTDDSCRFHMTTYMSTTTGHWMGPSAVVKEEMEIILTDWQTCAGCCRTILSNLCKRLGCPIMNVFSEIKKENRVDI